MNPDSDEEERKNILRQIDKFDKIGIDGVCAMLGDGLTDKSGAFNKGAGLLPIQVSIIRLFLESGREAKTYEEQLNAFAETEKHIRCAHNRIELMAKLEESVIDEHGATAWDRFLALRPNADNSWSDGGRPKNVGWALDDILENVRRRGLQ